MKRRSREPRLPFSPDVGSAGNPTYDVGHLKRISSDVVGRVPMCGTNAAHT